MIKILTAICIFRMCFSVVFGDSSNYESSNCENRDPARDVAFVRIGRYRKKAYPSRHNSIKISSFLGGFTDKGSEYQKTYLLSKYLRTNWFDAKLVCKSFDLELASFETLTEVEYFINIVKNHPFVISYGGYHMLVDGITNTPNSTTDWYWTNSGTKVSFALPWQRGEPNYLNEGEYCLALSAHEPSTLGFNDFPCQIGLRAFVCQRIDFFVPVQLILKNESIKGVCCNLSI